MGCSLHDANPLSPTMHHKHDYRGPRFVPGSIGRLKNLFSSCPVILDI